MRSKLDSAKKRIIAKYVFLAATVIVCVGLCIGSLLPGDASAATSDNFGNALDSTLTDLGDDTVKDIPPTDVAIGLYGAEAEEELHLFVGESALAGAVYTPAETSVNHRRPVWTSSDPAVVSVGADGRIAGLAPGEADVTLSLADDADVTDVLHVEVREVYALNIDLTFAASGEKTADMLTGTSLMLSCAFEPANVTASAAEFLSSDDDVASVDAAGVAHALSPGESEITATYTSLDGSVTFTDTVTVSVTTNPDPIVPAESVTADLDGAQGLHRDEGGTLFVYVGETAVIPVSATPSNATEKSLRATTTAGGISASVSDGELTLTGISKCAGRVSVISLDSDNVLTSFDIEVRNSSLGAVMLFNGTPLESGEGGYSASLTAGDTADIHMVSDIDGVTLFVSYATSDPSVAEIYNGSLISHSSSERGQGGVLTVTVTVSDSPDFAEGHGNITETYTLSLKIARQPFSTGMSNWLLFIRKLFGHFGAFMFLGVLASVTFLLFSNGSWRSRLTAFAGAAVFGFTFACLTELLQTDLFTTGRGASFDDVITDCRGYFLSALPILVICLVVLAAKEISAARKYGALLKEKDEYLRPAALAAADIEEAETPARDRQKDAPPVSPDKTDDKDGNVTNT